MIPKFVEILGKNGQPMAVPMTVNRNDGSLYMSGETVTRGATATDSLAQAATYLFPTITDEDDVVYTRGVDFQLTGGDVEWLTAGDEPAEGKDYTVSYLYAGTGAAIVLEGIPDAAHYVWAFTAYAKTTGATVVTATDGTVTFDFKLTNHEWVSFDHPIQFGTGKTVVIHAPALTGGTVINTLSAIASGKGG